MNEEKLRGAFSAAASACRMMGFQPEAIVAAGFEWIATFCLVNHIEKPGDQFEKALKKVEKQRAHTVKHPVRG